MKSRTFTRIFAVITLLGILTGCNDIEHSTAINDSTIESECAESQENETNHIFTDTAFDTENDAVTGNDTEGDVSASDDETSVLMTEDGTQTQPTEELPDVPDDETKTCAHSFGDWRITNATCTEDGVKQRSCSVCGKTEKKTVSAVGHSWNDGMVTVSPKDCFDVGAREFSCKVCGKNKTEPINGKHTFGEWTYEDYTYIVYEDPNNPHDGYEDEVVPSHRKARTCGECGYKEYGNTPDHSCRKGSKNHTVTTVKEGTCTVPATMRSTCKICGWYVEYDGKKSSHTNVIETYHLIDYGPYTNELDAKRYTCTVCKQTDVVYIHGEGWDDDNRYEAEISLSGGTAYSFEHPEYQTVRRDFVYDSNGYVKQFTVYWWYNGQHRSEVIKCDKASLVAWFAEYDMDGSAPNIKFQIRTTTSLKPYKVSWTG